MKIKGIGKETTEELRKNIPSYISPWQYKDSEIHIVNIESVLSDVLTNWNQEMRFRQGFSVNEDNSLNLPTFFMQINGIYKDKNKYREFLNQLETPNTIRIKETRNMFKIKKIVTKEELFANGKLDISYLEKCNCSYFSVNEHVENMLCRKLQAFYEQYPNLDDTVYSKIINLEEKFLGMLHNFDYCFSNPKILVENMDDDNFTDSDKYVLIFLYSLGFDILIFSPKGLKFLDNYKINSITLDCYLSNVQEVYDYRDDKDIEKEEKVKTKKEKQEQKRTKRRIRGYKIKSFLFGTIIVLLILAAIGGLAYWIYYEENLSVDAKMEKYTESLSFQTPVDTVYVNTDDVIIYKYPHSESETFTEGSSISLEKHEELKRIAYNDTWSKFKHSSGTVFYLKNDDVRKEYYKETVQHFEKTAIAPQVINVYEFMNVEEEPYFTYEQNDTIVITGYTDEFYQVSEDDKVGFILKDALEQQNVTDIVEEEGNSISVGTIVIIILVILFAAAIFLGLFFWYESY